MELTRVEIKKDPYREPVLKMLEEAILKYEFKPGDHLVESKISALFGISRGPVREAIIELEHQGLVERIPYKGAVVSQLSAQDIYELKTCRMNVEILAAKLILEKEERLESALKEIGPIVKEMAAAVSLSDLPLMLAQDYQFHNALVLQTGNNLLAEMWKPISVRLRRYLFLNSREKFIPLSEAVKLHQDIYDALFSHDLEKVTHLLQSHQCWS